MGRPKKKRPHVGNPEDPLALSCVMSSYLEHLRVVNLTKQTIINHANQLYFFLEWCGERGLARATEVTRPMILQYQRHVFHFRRPETGEPLGFVTQMKRVTSVMGMFKWATRTSLIPFNPATEIDLPKIPHRLPRYVLSPEEVDRVMTQPDLTDAIGIRDRAMLELLYSTGMRRGELMNLKLFDLDLDRGCVIIREGKNRSDRIVPIGERAVAWMQKYLADVRPWFALDPDNMMVFLSHRGAPLSKNQISYSVRQYLKSSGIGKKGACHMFRHAMATAMLENGADIRFIQQMLGHRRLDSTQIYTHVSIRKLKEIHAATHPSSRVKPRDEVRTLPPIDHSAALAHVDESIDAQRVEAIESERTPPAQRVAACERRVKRAVGSYALKALRRSEREKRELLSSLAAGSLSSEEEKDKLENASSPEIDPNL